MEYVRKYSTQIYFIYTFVFHPFSTIFRVRFYISRQAVNT